MEIEARYIVALQEKDPILAIGLQSCEMPIAYQFSRHNELGISTQLSKSSAWFAGGYTLDKKQLIVSWLDSCWAHRLILLFQSIQELRDWLLQSDMASIIERLQVQVIVNQHVESEISHRGSHIIWEVPGFDVGYYDPEGRFSSQIQILRSWDHQRCAVVHEMMKYGRWVWPNLWRRLSCIEHERSLKSSVTWQGIPVLVCGAGPSMSLLKQDLQEYRDYFFVISAGTGINVLENLGLEPHMAMSIDPFRAQFSRFCLVNHVELLYAAGWRSNYRALSCMTGPRLLLPGSQAYPIVMAWQEELNLENIVFDEGYNVVAMAMSLAANLKATGLVLAGIDLAFSKNKQLYGAGVSSYERSLQAIATIEAPCEATSVSGSRVTTLAKWLSEAQWLHEFTKTHDLPVYRLGKDALAVEGLILTDLRNQSHATVQRDYDGFAWQWYQEQQKPMGSSNHMMEESLTVLKNTDEWLLSHYERLTAILQHNHIDMDRGPTYEQGRTTLVLTIEIECQEVELDLEQLPLYPWVLIMWDQCYKKIYGVAFDPLNALQSSWLSVWILARRLAFLQKGTQFLIQECQETMQGYSCMSREV